MMSSVDWESIRHFQASEFSVPEAMDLDFMRQLDAFREKIGERIYINFSNGSEKHEAGSLHYSGKAADIMFDRVAALDDVLVASRFFTEIGYYPDWDRPDKRGIREGGLHVGYDRFAVAYRIQRKYWLGVRDLEGKTNYLGFTEANLRRYGVLV
jgi:hypothetical protein